MGKLHPEPTETIILEVGAYETRIGFAGEKQPRYIIPTVVADSREPLFSPTHLKSLTEVSPLLYFGKDAVKKNQVLKLHYFIANDNYSFLESFLKYCGNLLGVEFADHSLVYLHHTNLPESKKEALKSLFLFKLGCQQLAFLNQSTAVLTVIDADTGVLIDLGEKESRIDTIYKGYPNLSAYQEFSIGGQRLTAEFLNKLYAQGVYGTKKPYEFYVNQIKEQLAVCVMDYEDALQKIEKGDTSLYQEVVFPDQNKAHLNAERFEIVESYFRPELFNSSEESLPELAQKAVKSWDRTAQAELLESIILYGGGSAIPGLVERLENEIKRFFPKILKINVHAYPEEPNLVWLGASVLISQKVLTAWITREDLEKPQGGN